MRPPTGSSGRAARDDLADLELALFGVLLLASSEVVQLVKVCGLDTARAISLFDLSSGRNECTRALSLAIANEAMPRAAVTAGKILEATRWAASVGVIGCSGRHVTSLAAELWASIVGRTREDADAWSAVDFWTSE